MAKSGQVKILEDKSEELSLLSEYLKNPKLIDRLSSDIKKLNALTEEEEQKAKDARALIAEHKKILNDLETKTALHEDEKKRISDAWSVLGKAREDHAAFVNDSTSVHKSNIEIFENEKKQFANDIGVKNTALSIAQKSLQEKLTAFENSQKLLAKEKERVAGIEAAALNLKAKYERKLAAIQADTE